MAQINSQCILDTLRRENQQILDEREIKKKQVNMLPKGSNLRSKSIDTKKHTQNLTRLSIQ
jgi:hypothetical protein